MKYFKKLEGNRIYLTPLNVEDAEIYTKWMNDHRVTDGINHTRDITNLENEKIWISNTLAEGKYTLGIVLKATDDLIGNCGFIERSPIDRTGTLGIFIGEEKYRGMGYGSEALELLIKYGFDILNLHHIDLGVFSFNERAIKCYKRLGFQECGRRHKCYFLNGQYHDEILMEMLEEDYRK